MLVKEFIKELENKGKKQYASLVKKICRFYEISLDSDLYDGKASNGAYLNGTWLSLTNIFNLMNDEEE